MTENLSLSWDDYQKNICQGFGALQQRGEFVDMTLAADGHHVKVHQMVMSLVSPFIKQLIASANCPHPVIFLNRVSMQTMQSILEYAYTGEVVVRRDKIKEFLEACQDLHIKGLESMAKGALSSQTKRFTVTPNETDPIEIIEKSNTHSNMQPNIIAPVSDNKEDFFHHSDDDDDDDDGIKETTSTHKIKDETAAVWVSNDYPENAPFKMPGSIKYSVSRQGNLQLVLNRYMYSLRHVRRSNQRFWRCTSQQASRCPAFLTTLQDQVIERANLHNHQFHDKQIAKRVRSGNMYTSITEVEGAAKDKKRKIDEADALKKGLNDTYENL